MLTTIAAKSFEYDGSHCKGNAMGHLTSTLKTLRTRLTTMCAVVEVIYTIAKIQTTSMAMQTLVMAKMVETSTDKIV